MRNNYTAEFMVNGALVLTRKTFINKTNRKVLPPKLTRDLLYLGVVDHSKRDNRI